MKRRMEKVIYILAFIMSTFCLTGQTDTSVETVHVSTTTPVKTITDDSRNYTTKNRTVVVESDRLLRLSDLKSASYFLIVTSIGFILINGFLFSIIITKWGHISDSDYRNSCLFCLLLTVADLAFSALIGLPVGLRFSFGLQLSHEDSMEFYTTEVAYVFFEYLTILRMIIIAALSADRCLHIIKPFKYMLLATRLRINILCVIIVSLPLIRMIPMIFGKIHCVRYTEPTTYNEKSMERGIRLSGYAPLRCDLDVNATKHPGLNKALIYLFGLISILTWIVILVSNLTILSLVIKKGTGYFSRKQREEMNKKLLKSCTLIMLVTIIFAITNFPITYVKIASFLKDQRLIERGKIDYVLEYYFLILSFASLYFNPWIHVLRIRSIKEAVLGIKKIILRAVSTQSTTVMPSPNPRLSKMSLQAMNTKRKSSAMKSTVREESPAAVREGTKPNLEQLQEVEE